MEAVGGQKHTSEAKNGMKELIKKKKYLTKVYFNQFVANVLRDNTGIVIFDV